MSASKVILVLGATGSQGSGVVKALAAVNSALSASAPDTYKIVAVTRSASSDKAQRLLSLRGTSLLEGNVNDAQALFHDAAQLGLGPIYGVFAVFNSMDNADGGVVGEERQAKAVADEASKAGVKHYVYSSVDMGGLDKTEVSHFESKRRVAAYIKTSLPNLPLTILSPTYSMENLKDLSSPMWPVFSSLLLNAFSDESKTIQMVAGSDIGRWAVHVLENPSRYIGQSISLAGDELTVPQIRAGFKNVFGYDMPAADKAVGDRIRAQVEDLDSMFKFFETHGYKADIPALRKQVPEHTTWEAFLKEEVKPFAPAPPTATA